MAEDRKVVIDGEEVGAKLNRMFEDWEAGYRDPTSAWNGLDGLAVLSGKSTDEEDEGGTKLEQFQLWLTGFQFPDTLFFFCRNGFLYILTSPKKLSHLEQVKTCRKNVILMSRSEDNKVHLQTIETQLKSINPGKAVVGKLKGPLQKGQFVELCEEVLLKRTESRSADSAISKCMSVLTRQELEHVKGAAHVVCSIMKGQLISRIESVLDNEQNETHAQVAACAEKISTDKKAIEKLRDKCGIEAGEIEVIYSNVQSGGEFDLRAGARPSNSPLSQKEGCILVCVGCKYKELCANITRTMILDGKKEHKEAYSFVLEVMNIILRELKIGKVFSDIYESARSFINEKRPELLDSFVRNVGHCMGMDFRDPLYSINAKNKGAIVEAGMVFNISVGFSGVPRKNGKTFAVWVADTVEVMKDGTDPKVLTSGVSKRLEHMSYELEDDGNETKEKEKKTERQTTSSSSGGVPSAILNNADTVILKERLRRKNGGTLEGSPAQDRDGRQAELRKKKMLEIKNRFKDNHETEGENNKKNVRQMSSVKCFDDAASFPKDLRPNKIYVDPRSESVMVPINGNHIPFHVSTIKNVTCNPEEANKHYTMRVNFQVPGSQTFTVKAEENPLPDLANRNALFVKELLYRSEDGKQLQAVFRSIKELIKRVKQEETEADVARDLADQEKIQLNRSGRRVMLKDLMVRPNIQGGRKVIGTLEAHTNGLRFTVNSRGGQMDHVDVTYSNVKHAVFQPCEKELIVLVHFFLKSPIMVGKKKTQDVQFYTEAGLQTDDLDNRRGRSYHDPDETQAEIREREMRKRLNNEFKRFVQQVEEVSRMEFDIPYRELMFTGVPAKSNVEILPTSNCLVHLIEWPPFVLPLEDIEIVSFERVQHGLRNFDVVFVFQDYQKPVKRIDLVPMEYLDNLKRWLNELEIVWYEGKNNLQWNNILKHIVSDVGTFVENGGFDYFLGDDDGGTDEEDEEDADDDYKDESSSSEFEEDSDEDADSDESSSGDESDDESFRSVDSGEEEGLSWDELEKQAKKDDRRRNYEDDDQDTRRTKKPKRH